MRTALQYRTIGLKSKTGTRPPLEQRMVFCSSARVFPCLPGYGSRFRLGRKRGGFSWHFPLFKILCQEVRSPETIRNKKESNPIQSTGRFGQEVSVFVPIRVALCIRVSASCDGCAARVGGAADLKSGWYARKLRLAGLAGRNTAGCGCMFVVGYLFFWVALKGKQQEKLILQRPPKQRHARAAELDLIRTLRPALLSLGAPAFSLKQQPPGGCYNLGYAKSAKSFFGLRVRNSSWTCRIDLEGIEMGIFELQRLSDLSHNQGPGWRVRGNPSAAAFLIL